MTDGYLAIWRISSIIFLERRWRSPPEPGTQQTSRSFSAPSKKSSGTPKFSSQSRWTRCVQNSSDSHPEWHTRKGKVTFYHPAKAGDPVGKKTKLWNFPKIHPSLFENLCWNKYSNIPQQTERRALNMHHRTKTDLKADPLYPRGVGVRFQFIQPLAGFAQESRNIYFHALAYSVELCYCILK